MTNYETRPLSESLRPERRDDAAVLWLDMPGSVNTLQRDTDMELGEALGTIEADARITALVVASAKPSSFLAGANVEMLLALAGKDEAHELSRRAQKTMDRFAEFRAPIVAAIDGHCLGGGLELALACHARVVADTEATRLGQPEIRLGLIPGAGGTQRLPRLVGLEQALKMILGGRRLRPAQALDVGLVDEVVHPAILVEVALERARELARQRLPKPKTKAKTKPANHDDEGVAERLRAVLTEGNPIGRWVVYRGARQRAQAKTHDNIPAATRVIEVVRAGLEQGVDVGMRREAEAFGELACSREARNLMRLFITRSALDRESGVDDDVRPRPVAKLGVLGAGLMGSGIAYVSAAEAELHVRLIDLEREQLRDGLRSVRKILDERVNEGAIDERARERVLARIHPSIDHTGLGRADLVIEAVAEKLDLKREVLRQVEAVTRADTIFASNTSAIPIARIAEAAERPHNVVGMHYFSPVHRVPLLEVVRAKASADEAVATAVALGKRQGRTVIVVNDSPGFYTSRVLGRYLREAVALLLEGAAIDKIDEAMENLGFPVGPFMLLDEVGLDVALDVADTLEDAFGEAFALPGALAKLRGDNRHGRKNGRGFYRYEDGERVDHEIDEDVYALLHLSPKSVDPERITKRCLAAFVNEAAWCYGDGVLRSARDGDVGAVLGLGFPAHLGGPFAWLRDESCPRFLSQLADFRREHGKRFAPAPILEEFVRRECAPHDPDAPPPGWHREA